MPGCTDKKREYLENQAELANAFRALVNALGFPNEACYFEGVDTDKGALSYTHSDSSDSPQPTYDTGMRARAFEKKAEGSSSLTEEQKIQDRRDTGMLTTEGLLTLLDFLNSSSNSPLALQVTALSKKRGALQTSTYGDTSKKVVALNHASDHYYPVGMKSGDITTSNYTCAFASLLEWMAKNNELDRLQPLINKGKKAGVSETSLALLQGLVDRRSISIVDKDKEALLAHKTFEDYKNNFLKSHHGEMTKETTGFNKYDDLVACCMKVAGQEFDPQKGSRLSQMSIFVENQDKLLKHFEKQKQVSDTANDDAGRNRSDCSSSEDSLGMD